MKEELMEDTLQQLLRIGMTRDTNGDEVGRGGWVVKEGQE